MGSYAQSGRQSITGNVASLPIGTASSQAAKQARIVANGSTQNLATVTTGKTAYLMKIWACGSSNGQLSLYDNSATLLLIQLYAANTAGVIDADGAPVAVYTSGQIIKASATTGHDIDCVYIEV